MHTSEGRHPIGRGWFDLVVGAFLSLLPNFVCGCGFSDLDLRSNVYHGDEARNRILNWAHVGRGENHTPEPLPDSATDFYIYDGGSFNGIIRYSSFTCGSREDCLKAFERLSGFDRDRLKPYKPSMYAVVMEGPGFYSRSLQTDRWDVRGIRNGVWFEEVSDRGPTIETSGKDAEAALKNAADGSTGQDGRVDGPHDRMTYYAIDFDRCRIYYHYESGGFLPVRYVPGRRGNPIDH
jgi:hypothetical protein